MTSQFSPKPGQVAAEATVLTDGKDTSKAGGLSRLGYIDGLRGIAAMLVLIEHGSDSIIAHSAAPKPVLTALDFLQSHAFNLGHFGVALFFLVSGFVIPFSFREPAALRRFALMRLLRLYPAYWLSTLLAVAILLAMGKTLPSPASLIANLTMLQRYLGQPDVLPAYWTLGVEISFYLLCALLYAQGLLKRTRPLVALIAFLSLTSIAMALVTVSRGHPLPAGMPENLSLMLVGTLFRLGWLEGDRSARRLIPIAIAAVVVCVPVAEWAASTAGLKSSGRVVAYTVAMWSSVAVFALILHWRPQFNPAVLWLGAVSYSVYLFHGSALILFNPLLHDHSALSGLIFTGCVVAMTLLLSWLAWQWIEKPCIALGHSLAARQGHMPPQAVE